MCLINNHLTAIALNKQNLNPVHSISQKLTAKDQPDDVLRPVDSDTFLPNEFYSDDESDENLMDFYEVPRTRSGKTAKKGKAKKNKKSKKLVDEYSD